MKNERLKPCPFCGGKAIYGDVKAYMDDGVCVRCVECGARSVIQLINHPKYNKNGIDESTRYTQEQAKCIVAKKWNRRADT